MMMMMMMWQENIIKTSKKPKVQSLMGMRCCEDTDSVS